MAQGFPSGLVRLRIYLTEDRRLLAKLKMWVQFLDQEDPLEKEMATFSSILAWEIPWRKDPGRLQSKGSQELDMT